LRARYTEARDEKAAHPKKKPVMIRHHDPARRRIDLDRAEALRLLGSVSLGRVVFTRQALPTVRPVNHVLDAGDIVIRTQEGAALTSHARPGDGTGVVVAYEADAIDPDTHLGWSVVVTGYARLVTDPAELVRIRRLLTTWAPQEGMDQAVRIRPDLVTGVLLTAAGGVQGVD
jgi:nitroimidazol reductase NimA-like FMN-containing flavoprotein (pyridoxamine 5'-phosphate oxidase superfamily)